MYHIMTQGQNRPFIPKQTIRGSGFSILPNSSLRDPGWILDPQWIWSMINPRSRFTFPTVNLYLTGPICGQSLRVPPFTDHVAALPLAFPFPRRISVLCQNTSSPNLTRLAKMMIARGIEKAFMMTRDSRARRRLLRVRDDDVRAYRWSNGSSWWLGHDLVDLAGLYS
jgi:hypothetical protein